MDSKIIVVSAGIISKDGKILISKRRKDAPIEPNKWEFPGGKIEFLESPEQALIREIKEELDIKIKVEKLFDAVSHVYTRTIHIVMIVYLAEYVSGEIRNFVHQDSKWVNVKELSDYEFVAADVPIVKKLMNPKKSNGEQI